MGYRGDAVMRLDASKMVDGQRAGFATLSKRFIAAGVEKEGGNLYFYTENGGKATRHGKLKGCLLYTS